MSTSMARAVRQLASTGRMSSLAVPVLADAADTIDKLTAQRDELLAALRAMDKRFRWLLSAQSAYPELVDENVLDKAYAAIEKAEATSHV
jgi:hypothetical protein